MFETRRLSLELTQPLSAEDMTVQPMDDASPTKWHLAHVTWFFETFVLERFEADFVPFDPAFRVLFNSYYQGIGAHFMQYSRVDGTFDPGLPEMLLYADDR